MKKITNTCILMLLLSTSISYAKGEDLLEKKMDAYSSIATAYLGTLFIFEQCRLKSGLESESEQTSRQYIHNNFSHFDNAKKAYRKFLIKGMGQDKYMKNKWSTEDKFFINQVPKLQEFQEIVSTEASCKSVMSNLRSGYGDLDIAEKDELETLFFVEKSPVVNTPSVNKPPYDSGTIYDKSLIDLGGDLKKAREEQARLDSENVLQKIYRRTHDYLQPISK